jgi:hypothetical protein
MLTYAAQAGGEAAVLADMTRDMARIWFRCSRMLTYAHVCSRMLTYAHVCSRMLTYAHVCSRMLTYAAPQVAQDALRQRTDANMDKYRRASNNRAFIAPY